jgi:hypothetical protein
MTTYRERREARAGRLDEWADKRKAKADTAFATASTMADAIPFGQPILVGHHSERRDRNYRDRIGQNMARGVDHSRKAESMRSRAANIRAAADHAIYSDDVDAVERLAEKLADLEAQRDRIKRYNATARKGSPDPSILDEKQRRDLESCARFQPEYFARKKQQMPSYALANLSGVISTTRKRLDSLRGAS